MKGKLLKSEEILNMNGEYVYIIPGTGNSEDEGRAQIVIHENGMIEFVPDNSKFNWCASNYKHLENFEVYEWLEEDSTSKLVDLIVKILSDIDVLKTKIEDLELERKNKDSENTIQFEKLVNKVGENIVSSLKRKGILTL